MSAPTSIRRAGYGTTTPTVRLPDPYLVARSGGTRWDGCCRSCPVHRAGIPTLDAAQAWCRQHRCDCGGQSGKAQT